MFGVAAVGPGLRLGHTRTLTRTISKANRKVKQLLRRPVRALTCRCADYRISGIGNWLFRCEKFAMATPYFRYRVPAKGWAASSGQHSRQPAHRALGQIPVDINPEWTSQVSSSKQSQLRTVSTC